jgi:hypothetical protein
VDRGNALRGARARRSGAVAAAALAAAVLVPQAPGADADWVKRQGRYYIAWVPTAQWTVAENPRTLAVRSPGGEASVEVTSQSSAPGPVPPAQVEARSLSRSGGFGSVSVVARSRPVSLGDGITTHVVEFLATRLRDGARVHGVLTTKSYSRFGQYGWAAYVQAAPAAAWEQWRPTLETIQERLVVIGRSAG